MVISSFFFISCLPMCAACLVCVLRTFNAHHHTDRYCNFETSNARLSFDLIFAQLHLQFVLRVARFGVFFGVHFFPFASFFLCLSCMSSRLALNVASTFLMQCIQCITFRGFKSLHFSPFRVLFASCYSFFFLFFK